MEQCSEVQAAEGWGWGGARVEGTANFCATEAFRNFLEKALGGEKGVAEDKQPERGVRVRAGAPPVSE